MTSCEVLPCAAAAAGKGWVAGCTRGRSGSSHAGCSQLGSPDAPAALSCPVLCAAVAVPCAGSGPRVDCPPCGVGSTVPSWLHALFQPCLVWWWVTGTRATALLSLLVRRLQLLLTESQGAACRPAHSARCSPGCRLGVRVQLVGGAALSVPHQHPCSWHRWLVVTALH